MKFVGHFWRELWKRLNTTLNFNSAYHPQSDSQTEVINRIMGSMLRCLAHDEPKMWDLSLPQIDFTIKSDQ